MSENNRLRLRILKNLILYIIFLPFIVVVFLAWAIVLWSLGLSLEGEWGRFIREFVQSIKFLLFLTDRPTLD